MRVYLTALGCKLNQSEVESWARSLAGAGCEIVHNPADADLSIINTCTVTHVAARKSRQLVRRLARANPQAHIVVAGCYAEIHPEEAARLSGSCLVLGTRDKERLVQNVLDQLGLSCLSPAGQAVRSTRATPSMHTRAFVKVQDGCDNACTYCIVRIARGKQRSRPMRAVLDEVSAREDEGYQEVVLTGVHIGSYGGERNETLADLIREILRCTCFPRLRLTSIEPWDLSPELLGLWESPRLCRHLHLPLQSGCDATLGRMNRRYTAAQFREVVCRARAAIPDLAVTTDLIVGFPGETEAEFEDSVEFVAGIEFARTHIFPFSARPGTTAASLPGQISPLIKKQRAERMADIARRSSRAFRQHFLGQTLDVLWEQCKGDTWRGLTDNYIRVMATSLRDLHNQIIPTRLLELTDQGVRGELVPQPKRLTAAGGV
jgi:threonylcarbamoyladenosine tRNA methylthiotransferase MtaB